MQLPTFFVWYYHILAVVLIIIGLLAFNIVVQKTYKMYKEKETGHKFTKTGLVTGLLLACHTLTFIFIVHTIEPLLLLNFQDTYTTNASIALFVTSFYVFIAFTAQLGVFKFGEWVSGFRKKENKVSIGVLTQYQNNKRG